MVSFHHSFITFLFKNSIYSSLLSAKSSIESSFDARTRICVECRNDCSCFFQYASPEPHSLQYVSRHFLSFIPFVAFHLIWFPYRAFTFTQSSRQFDFPISCFGRLLTLSSSKQQSSSSWHRNRSRHCLLRPHRSNGNHFRKMNYIPLAPFQVPMCTNCQLFGCVCAVCSCDLSQSKRFKNFIVGIPFQRTTNKNENEKGAFIIHIFHVGRGATHAYDRWTATFSLVEMEPKKGEAGMEAMEVATGSRNVCESRLFSSLFFFPFLIKCRKF